MTVNLSTHSCKVTFITEMASDGRLTVDPENEALRRNVEGPPDIKEKISLLLEKTSRIHAAYLFDASNMEVTQKLCLLLSATRSSHQYNGWESFASKIGLSSEKIKCIDFHFNTEDPTYHTLKAFTQYRDSTLDKIIIALESIGRYDVILQVSDHFVRLVDDVIRNRESVNQEESGYFSLSDGSDQQHEDRTDVILPSFLPSVPLIFRDFTSAQVCSITEVPNTPTVEHEDLVGLTNPEPKIPRPKYAKKVMVTFASDGEETAYKVASIFRQERSNKQRIGVLILNDHVAKVNSNPEQFIFSSFEQVDYVIPIITEGYLQAVSAKNSKELNLYNRSIQCIDTQYVKYIYLLMVTNYLHNECINEKVRCVVPDKLLYLTQKHALMKSPIFQAWVKQSETEELSIRILRANV